MSNLALIANALVSGLLLAGFYAAVSVGVAISFGMLEVVNIAHPAFIVLGSYAAWLAQARLGIDPILAGVLLCPAFFVLGLGLYRLYHASFERRGRESLRGLAFFFGILLVTEVGLILAFGVDYRLGAARYVDVTWRLGFVDLPLRLLLPFVASLAMTLSLQAYLSRTFFGRTVLAVGQDPLALQMMGVDPVRVKQAAFGISIATAGLAGALLLVIQPVQPSLGRDYIGLVFAVTVLGGMGSIPGTLAGAAVLGIAESFTSTFFGPSWAPAVSFGLLLVALAARPSGLLGRSG
ncbi:MAG TPA: branched-chain amino acid ABC transporter permease [Myxococcales bacterium]